jgi:hypothetical protein
MTNNTAKFANQSAPSPTSVKLSNGFKFTMTAGCWCPECGESFRACDAEALDDDGVRLICHCGYLIFSYEPY